MPLTVGRCLVTMELQQHLGQRSGDVDDLFNARVHEQRNGCHERRQSVDQAAGLLHADVARTAGVEHQADGIGTGQDSGIEILLTDLGLPGMSGHELVEAALKINPALKVIIASGYSTSEDQNDRLKGARYLTKPFDMQQLRRVLES